MRLTPTEALRFVDYIQFADSGCWEWTGGRTTGNRKHGDPGGYGKFYLRGRTVLAHRVMFAAVQGREADTVEHVCRNRACVRPRCFEDLPIGENIRRGHGAAAENARKVACRRGHPLSGANLGLQRHGRFCRTCRREDYRRFHARHSRTGSGQ